MDKPEIEKPKLKKKYSSPKLTRYGTVQELTKQVGPRGTLDSGTFPRNRTGV
jgi:hypothetical protein